MTYQQESIKPYNEEQEKSSQVRTMFNRIAPTYDRLNRALSLGLDKRWRREAIRTLLPYAPQKMLDVATGTADFALLSMRILKPTTIIGIDLSEGMLEVGRKKIQQAGYSDQIHLQCDDCLNLSFADNTFDAVTVAYGVRNFADLDKGLREMRRVLKPGGRLVIIELSAPQHFPMRQLFNLYSRCYLSTVGKWISHDKQAYIYLPETMKAFPQAEKMKEILKKAG